MDGIASEIVLTHGVPLPQDVRLFSVLRREYKRLCAALRSFDLWFCMRDGVARNVCWVPIRRSNKFLVGRYPYLNSTFLVKKVGRYPYPFFIKNR